MWWDLGEGTINDTRSSPSEFRISFDIDRSHKGGKMGLALLLLKLIGKCGAR